MLVALFLLLYVAAFGTLVIWFSAVGSEDR